MDESLQQLLRVATRLSQTGRLQQATAAIQQALRGSAELVAWPDLTLPTTPHGSVSPESDTPVSGNWIAGTHSHASLTRRYKLHVPHGHAGQRLPLVLMLHGCTQDPDDFAAGTGMNIQAGAGGGLGGRGFFVLYPAQSQDANPQRCWNWFKHNHQERGRGEPALLASLVQTLVDEYAIDPQQVYVAGLSAGGAMAAILGAAYPEMFAAVGVHSGLAKGVAGNVSEALAAMRSGLAAAPSQHPVPTIVFHGDHDQTVHPRNGEQVLAAVLPVGASARVEQGVAPQGRKYTRSVHRDGGGNVVGEHWLVHGAGHAWSGGGPDGSYTDGQGPDATAEMLRFFHAHPRPSAR